LILKKVTEEQIKKLPEDVFKAARKAIALAHLSNTHTECLDVKETITHL